MSNSFLNHISDDSETVGREDALCFIVANILSLSCFEEIFLVCIVLFLVFFTESDIVEVNTALR